VSSFTHVFNHTQLKFIVSSPVGPVAKDLLKRGKRVESRAKRNLNGVSGAPRRVNTGHLRNSIGTNLIVRPDGLGVRVGTGVAYALFVHDGTGLYGPKHAVIRPKHGKVLVFRSKIYGAKKGKHKGKVFAAFVRGMKPNPFLKDALPAFKSSE
jgi:hypothetical protein